MEENKLKVLITTSGVGSRLGNITTYINKSLVKLGDKPIISHIIDTYPDADFVITLGHYGDYVKEYLTLAYPDRNFDFVYVNPYEGEGSGLIKSISFAKENLQCPFIFHVCDTILNETPPTPTFNWMSNIQTSDADLFRTIRAEGGLVTKINEKGEINYDYGYIGVAGIYDYKLFWDTVDDIMGTNQPSDSSDCHIFMEMLNEVDIHTWKVSKWFDTGNVNHLSIAKSNYPPKYNVLEKSNESIYFIDNSVIKFFGDEKICDNRVKRAQLLDGLVPKLEGYTRNFYKYEHAKGDLLADGVTDEKIVKLIEWAEDNLWTPILTDDYEFENKCRQFYITKTKKRIKQFLENNNLKDGEDTINDVLVPSCETMLNMIDWDRICNTESVRFHGDFILDNILYNDDQFILLDWRQDFGGDIRAGDKYYDLSKLNHNLVLNHHILSEGHFFLNKLKDNIQCDVYRSHNLATAQQALISTLEIKGIDTYKINILTPLIWLNMSPLHSYPLNNFLFYFGKYNLWKQIKNMG